MVIASGSQTRRASSILQEVTAEALGSLLLAAVVTGSGVAAQTLSPQDTGLHLLENAIATALGLFALILVFSPISGAHFNPIITLVEATFQRSYRPVAPYVMAQIAGCVAGTMVANFMYGEPAVSWSSRERLSGPHLVSEALATAGLVVVVFSLARSGRSNLAPAAVGAYIGAAALFTSSTGFANPAISIGRMFTDTFAGIAPASVPGFIVAQLIGGGVGFIVIRYLYSERKLSALSRVE